MPTLNADQRVVSDQSGIIERFGFLPVPAGTVFMGLDEKIAERFVASYGPIWTEFFRRETPQHEVTLNAFQLARYPVTNTIYAQFMAADGYHITDYWTPDGWAWRLRTNRTEPQYWHDPRFAGADRPVVGVSWFEAMALARWAATWTGLNVRLPTEAEWEWAARGNNSRWLYPWGGTWDASRLNSGVSGSDANPGNADNFPRTTLPVGKFSPEGDGPFGHGDLLGQVWEWTASLFNPYPYHADDGREDIYTPDRRVLRGGNWSDGKYANRVTTRYLYPPYYADLTTGVRLAAGGTFPSIAPRPKFDLVLYGRSAFCPDLIKTKQWLHAWNVPYRQLNVDLDEQAASRLDRWLGTRTIPTLVVAPLTQIDPVDEPEAADLANLRNTDRCSMLHEPEQDTLRQFLVRNGFLNE